MVLNYIMLAAGFAVGIVVVICCVKSKNYVQYVDALKEEDFTGKNLYGIGFAFLDMIKFDFSSEKVQKVRDKALIIYGKKYCDFYLRASYAQRFTYCLLFACFSLMLGCIICGTDGLLMSGIGLAMTAAIYVYYGSSFEQKIQTMSENYMSDFPNAISSIALLVNAGMFLRDAWREVANSSDKPLYKQMQQVVEDMHNGMSEADALYAFSRRCSTPEIKKFISVIVQALEKGGKDLTNSLAKQSDSLWNEKRQRVLQKGEKASGKLMMPISIVFIGILLMVMIPILTNLGV